MLQNNPELKAKIDQLWNKFWSGGISNPLTAIEQITYLLFIRRLDDAHTLEESKALMLKQPMARRVFPEGTDPKGRQYDDLRWSRFKHFAPAEMFETCLLYTSPSPRDRQKSRMPSSA